jgi:hypothetical protein
MEIPSSPAPIRAILHINDVLLRPVLLFPNSMGIQARCRVPCSCRSSMLDVSGDKIYPEGDSVGSPCIGALRNDAPEPIFGFGVRNLLCGENVMCKNVTHGVSPSPSVNFCGRARDSIRTIDRNGLFTRKITLVTEDLRTNQCFMDAHNRVSHQL